MSQSVRDHENRKKTFSRIVDLLFYAMYFLLIGVTVLDMCGLPIIFFENKFVQDSNTLLKFLLILFSSVGIVVLNDKRELAKNVVDPLKRIEQLTGAGSLGNSNFTFLGTKDAFYIYFTQEIRHLENGAEV